MAPPPPVCPPPGCPPPPPPPAIPALLSSPAGALPGSLFVDGSQWCYVANDGKVYGGTGTSVGTPAGAVKGSFFIGGDGLWHYIDASGVERSLQSTSLGAKTAGAVTGSYHVDTAQAVAKSWVWYGTTNKIQWWNGF